VNLETVHELRKKMEVKIWLKEQFQTAQFQEMYPLVLVVERMWTFLGGGEDCEQAGRKVVV